MKLDENPNREDYAKIQMEASNIIKELEVRI
jgi:hypothetical protein